MFANTCRTSTLSFLYGHVGKFHGLITLLHRFPLPAVEHEGSDLPRPARIEHRSNVNWNCMQIKQHWYILIYKLMTSFQRYNIKKIRRGYNMSKLERPCNQTGSNTLLGLHFPSCDHEHHANSFGKPQAKQVKQTSCCQTLLNSYLSYFRIFSSTFSTPKTLFQHHHRSCLEIICAWRTLGVRFARFGNPARATHGTTIVPKVKKDLTGKFWSPKQGSGQCSSPSPKQYRVVKRHVSPTSGCNMVAIVSEKLATPMVSGSASAPSAT